jgi:peptidoglycan/xylan/chitin deacetylase (PgdA/CDA1 family)
MPVIPALQAMAHAARLDVLARAANRKRLLIITYHGIREDASPARSWLLLPVSEFARQMEFLHAHYDVLPIDDALATPANGRPRACITFDDGYRNNLELALPVLERLRLPATIYLPTAFIGSSHVLWTTRLDLGLPKASAGVRAQIADWVSLPHDPSTPAFVHGVSDALKALRPREREYLLTKIFGQIPAPSADEVKPHAFVTWPDVTRMESTGLISFGAHTAHHEIVRNLDDASLRDELQSSVEEVARRCSRVSRTFAYPNGRAVDFDERSAEILASLGCAAAVSTIEGLNDASTPPFALRRISVGGSMRFAEFRSRVSGLDAQARRLLGDGTLGR